MAYKGERKRRNDWLLNVSRSNLCLLSLLLNAFVIALLSKYCKLEAEKDTQIRIQKVYRGENLSFSAHLKRHPFTYLRTY